MGTCRQKALVTRHNTMHCGADIEIVYAVNHHREHQGKMFKPAMKKTPLSRKTSSRSRWESTTTGIEWQCQNFSFLHRDSTTLSTRGQYMTMSKPALKTKSKLQEYWLRDESQRPLEPTAAADVRKSRSKLSILSEKIDSWNQKRLNV